MEDSPQRKYCDCLMHVRVNTPSPYGICTNSVLKKYKIPRPECVYEFRRYTTDELLAYGRELEKRKHLGFKLGPVAAKGDRRALLRALNRLKERQ